jgi:ubiquitin-conjugating enzyme E2 Q
VDPPFIRVVYPRFAFHTGHVTWGGSLCLETLVNTGTAGGYQATYTMETLLCMVLFNMTSDTAGTAIKQGRIDFVRDREFDRLDYSLEEGRERLAC